METFLSASQIYLVEFEHLVVVGHRGDFWFVPNLPCGIWTKGSVPRTVRGNPSQIYLVEFERLGLRLKVIANQIVPNLPCGIWTKLTLIFCQVKSEVPNLPCGIWTYDNATTGYNLDSSQIYLVEFERIHSRWEYWRNYRSQIYLVEFEQKHLYPSYFNSLSPKSTLWNLNRGIASIT